MCVVALRAHTCADLISGRDIGVLSPAQHFPGALLDSVGLRWMIRWSFFVFLMGW